MAWRAAAVRRWVKLPVDLLVTILMWVFFVGGFILLYLPVYVLIALLRRDKEGAFQRLTHRFFTWFFWLLQLLAPGLRIEVPAEVRAIRSSVIVCNHLSYLDPLLLVSLFDRQKTIVKSAFFRAPLMGWIMRLSGYIPAPDSDGPSPLMMERIENLREHLARGGNLFVFPEGRRSLDGRLGPFLKGTFSIARRCQAPLELVLIRNTDILFAPRQVLLNTCIRNTITLERLGRLEPGYEDPAFSLPRLVEQAHRSFLARLEQAAEREEDGKEVP